MSRPKTEPVYITAERLKLGDEFKTHRKLKLRHLVHWTQAIHSGPMAGKILVMTRQQRPFFFDPESELIHCNPPKSILPDPLK